MRTHFTCVPMCHFFSVDWTPALWCACLGPDQAVTESPPTTGDGWVVLFTESHGFCCHVRHDRTCFWNGSHTRSKRIHKQIITHNHSLVKQKGGKQLSTLPIYLESRPPLSTVSLPRKHYHRRQRMKGCLSPLALLLQGTNVLPSSASLWLTDQDMHGLRSVILSLSGIEVVRKMTSL